LLGKDIDTNNETTTVAMQRRGKHTPTTIVTDGNGVMQFIARQLQQLDYKDGNGAVFSV
jgi:hypothetical protein